MGLFARGKSAGRPPVDPQWVRTPKGSFYRFNTFNPETAGIRGIGGVYVVWHSGARPRWVAVGQAVDLAKALDALLDDDEVMSHSIAGLYVTWAPIKPEYRAGVVKYLAEAMSPVVAPPDPKDPKIEPVPVLTPGEKPKAN